MPPPVAPPDRPSRGLSATLPRLTLWRGLAAALAATVVLGLPLTVLPLLEGMLFVSPGVLVARDIGLLLWLGVLPCLALLGLAWALQAATAPWLGVRARTLGWALLLLPLAALVLRQVGRVLLQWLQTVNPSSFELSAQGKLLLLGLCCAAALGWMLRQGWQTSLVRLLNFLEGLRPLAWLLLLTAAGLLAWQPPLWRGMSSTPVAGGPPAGPKRPHILLLTIDTVAAADADVCNPSSTVMPNLARFAQQATCFHQFQTAGNFTTASTSTMESGLLPWTHKANQPDAAMHPATQAHTLAQVLRSQGWRTHSITDNLLGSPRHRGTISGYDTAWLSTTGLWVNAARYAATRFPDTALPRLVAASLAFLAPIDQLRHRHESPYRSAAVYDDLHRLLVQEQASGQPQFVFALSLPPHAPYLPPPSTRYRLLPAGQLDTLDTLMPDNLRYQPAQQARVDQHRLRYRESLMAADMALGEALNRLARDGWLEQAIVVVTTDHGESFEKNFLGHAGPLLHQALVHGPLVIRLPGQTQGSSVHQVVSQADLAPTLLDLAGAPPLPNAEGRSLKPLLLGEALPEAPAFSMALEHLHRQAPVRRGSVAVRVGRWKLVQQLDDGSARLFDLSADPGETQDRSTAAPEVKARLQALIRTRRPGP